MGLDRIQTGRGINSVRMVSLKHHCIASAHGHDECNSTQSLMHVISNVYNYVIIARNFSGTDIIILRHAPRLK